MDARKTDDLKWVVTVTWSAPENIFTVDLSWWERDATGLGWQIEGAQTAPVVVPHRLSKAIREVNDALAAQVEEATRAPVDPF